jgi:hypothetical protein
VLLSCGAMISNREAQVAAPWSLMQRLMAPSMTSV